MSTALTMVLVIGMFVFMFAVLWSGPNSGPTNGYNSIGEIQPGESVTIYGTVEAPNGTAFTVWWDTTDHVHVENITQFYLVEINHPSNRVLINITNCQTFYFNDHSPGNITKVINGTNITVIGQARSGQNGATVVWAEHISEGKVDLGTGSSSRNYILLGFVIGCGVVLVICIIILLYRRDLHGKYLLSHPIEKPIEIEPAQVDRSGLAWQEQKMFKNYKLYSMISCAVMAVIIVVIIGIFFAFPSNSPLDICLFSLLLLTVPGSMAFTFTMMIYQIPRAIALDNNGLYLKYLSEKSSASRSTYVPWNDLKSLSGNPTRKQAILKMELKNGMEYVYLDTNLLTLVLDHYAKWKEAKGIAGQAEELKKPLTCDEIENIRAKSLASGRIEWDRNNLATKFLAIGSFLSVLGLLLGLLFLFMVPNYTITLFLSFLRVLVYPLTLGVMLILFSVIMPQSVGLSEDGIHLNYLYKKKEKKSMPTVDKQRIKARNPDFLPWSEIKMFKPVINRFFRVLMRNGQEITYFNIDPALGAKVALIFDERYRTAHPEQMPEKNPSLPIENLKNSSRDRLKWYILGPIIAGIAIILIFPIVWYYFGILGTVLMFGISVMAMLPIVVVPLLFYPQYKLAPISVGFSSTGIHMQYPKPRPFPGSLDLICWKEIDRWEAMGDADPHLIRAANLKDTKDRKILVIIKKSGFEYILGPVDIKIKETLEQKLPKAPTPVH